MRAGKYSNWNGQGVLSITTENIDDDYDYVSLDEEDHS